VAANGFLFVSGMVPLMPDGSGPVRGSIEVEARRALDNLKAVVEGAGAQMSDVVRVTAYLSDMNHFAAFNAVYKDYFPVDPPARTCFQAGRLPLDFQVEVDAIAVLPGH
jgi:2-iminobutanoate/2-iminopropanoate deaminase